MTRQSRRPQNLSLDPTNGHTSSSNSEVDFSVVESAIDSVTHHAASAFRWGWTLANQREPTDAERALFDLISPATKKTKSHGVRNKKSNNAGAGPSRDTTTMPFDLDWEFWASEWIESIVDQPRCVTRAHQSLLWVVALSALRYRLSQSTWLRLHHHLLVIWETCRDDPETHESVRLIVIGEMGLWLSAFGVNKHQQASIRKTSLDSINSFFANGTESIAAIMKPIECFRLAVGSVMRLQSTLPILGSGKWKRIHRNLVFDMGGWVAAMTRTDATAVFSSPALRRMIRRDDASLLDVIGQCEPESLKPAMDAALGERTTGGRLAWSVSLPETFWHDDEAAKAALLPEWDVRRGRVYVDYQDTDMHLEVMGGKCTCLAGKMQTLIEVDGHLAQPTGRWESTCEHSDDDVHYVEMEQPHEHNIRLHRQFMVVRDDRCVLIADTAIHESDLNAEPSAIIPRTTKTIRCVTRLPLHDSMLATEQSETREIFLHQKRQADTRRRAMVLPLAAPEWRLNLSPATLAITEDHFLVATTSGSAAVYQPIWFDFQARRFPRKRTWRQLTVAESLQLVPSHVAAAYRIQVGSEHWALYRSLRRSGDAGVTPRTFMGKHLLADFFAARFHPSDGGMEELVTVDAEP